MSLRKIGLEKVPRPVSEEPVSVALTDQTMQARYQRVLEQMKTQQLDCLVIYADKEHGGNFEYLTGFIPRFEEALLVIQRDKQYLLLGNENLKMVQYARIEAEAVHVPQFSLPNQPMTGFKPLITIFQEIGITGRIGVVGWKLFTVSGEYYDVPHYIVEALRACPDAELNNATSLFIDPVTGVRTPNNANEIAHCEYGASLASFGMLKALKALELGKTETEIGGLLNGQGQTTNVVTIAAFGQRFYQANLYPTNRELALGNTVSLTVGYRGGLTSRAGYAASRVRELPDERYLERVAMPYFATLVHWLAKLQIGASGAEIYAEIERVFPTAQYGWKLNPGHLTAEEEWLSSPIFPGSQATLKSGMLLQADIIPSVSGFAGAGAEDGLVLADAELRAELRQEYPALWQRFERRREYLEQWIGLSLSPEVLPLSDTLGYYNPLLLDGERAFVCLD